MSIPLRVGTLALIRSPRTFLGPWLVDVLAIATLCSLTALVDAAARSNSNVGALTVFLVTTAVGLLRSWAASSTWFVQVMSMILKR